MVERRVSANPWRQAVERRVSTKPWRQPVEVRAAPAAVRPPAPVPLPSLFFNGLGGFDPGRREYVIVLDKEQATPMPWINVLANENFGCLVSESALGYSWAANSQLNRLTPWSNDPVSDWASEAIYLRDEAGDAIWSPTPLPIREDEPYGIRHGAGYTSFTHRSHDLTQELLVFVPPDEPLKILRLKLRNESNQTRTLSAISYSEWVLGVTRAQSQHFVVTAYDEVLGALFARNAYNTDFKQRVAFVAAGTINNARRPRLPASPPTARSSSGATEACTGRRGCCVCACRGVWARDSTLARPCRFRCSCARRRNRRSCS